MNCHFIQRKKFAGNNSYPKFSRMHQSIRPFFVLILAILLLPACARKQAPSPTGGTDGGITGRPTDFGGDYIPDIILDYGPGADGLEVRNGDDMFNGREMVEGVLPSVYFGFDSSSVGADQRAKLQEAADYLAANPSLGLLVEGHCDWYGTAEYNLALGDRRSASVSEYLDTLGVGSDRIEKLSKGSLESTSGLAKSKSSQDRRADLILLK